ncbi:Multicopper oxidase with three cupredoxin domains (includes cell division protein FtsP and spore coat protein CotA) [Rhizobiales bacterium GAS188]|nr:Multicopper oxidase with three cupredoxin domains (includes cell division protein FtsP and spore coat protein CotA) [Rhizobiales bacterium GAS188]
MSLTLSRRGFLSGAAVAAAGIAAPGAGLTQVPATQCFAPRLLVERRQIEVNRKAASVFGLSGPDGRQGLVLGPDEPFLFDLMNRSGGPTIVHWHGQTPPTMQDGVVETGYEGPIEDGENHLYDFATRPGTHWMHSHLGLQEQALLAAPLIIRTAEDLALDAQEVTLFLHDFSFKDPEELMASILGVTSLRPSGMAMPGLCDSATPLPARQVTAGDVYLNHIDYDAYLANDRTLDDPEIVRTERGGRVRLRVINGASGTAFWIDLGEAKGQVIAADGNPVKPVEGSRFPLAQGQRLDILVDVPPGTSLPVLAQREGDRQRTGIVLASPGAAIARISSLTENNAAPVDLSLEARLEAVTPLPVKKPDTKRQIALAGTMTPFLWTINDRLWADRKAIRVDRGERVLFEIGNASLMAHAMHLHGHVFQVVALNGQPLAGAVRDTVLVPALGSVMIAFDADNLGRWLFHCHNLWHMAGGMMTELDYKYAA